MYSNHELHSNIRTPILHKAVRLIHLDTIYLQSSKESTFDLMDSPSRRNGPGIKAAESQDLLQCTEHRHSHQDDETPTEDIQAENAGGCCSLRNARDHRCFCHNFCDDNHSPDCLCIGPINFIMAACPCSNAGYSCTTTTYSFHEVSKHNTEESAWLLVGDDIFDVTEYLARHPGGKESILRKSGGIADCSEDFFFHSKRGRSLWKSCYIGKIRKCYCHPHSTMHRPNEQVLHVNLRERLQNFFGGIMARVHSDAVT